MTATPTKIVIIPAKNARVGDVLVTPSDVYRIEAVEQYGVRAPLHNNEWPIVGLYGGSRKPWGDGVRVFRGADEPIQVVQAVPTDTERTDGTSSANTAQIVECGKYRFAIRQDGQTVVTAVGHGVPLDVIPASKKLPHEVVSDWMDEWGRSR